MRETQHPTYTRYLVREDGQITGLWGILSPAPDPKGYLTVGLSDGKHRQTYRVHRLVCETFHGPKPFPEAQVRHLDGNKRNNHADNLRWGTTKENGADITLHGSRSGEKNHAAELTWPLVREIRAKYATGNYRHDGLAAEYGVVKATITYLLANQTWVDPDYIPSGGKPRVKMTVERAEEIRAKFAAHGGTRTAFAQLEGISAPLLSDILNGKKYASGK
jgi:hypothetical protein